MTESNTEPVSDAVSQNGDEAGKSTPAKPSRPTPSRRPGLISGMLSPWRGAKFFAGHPKLIPLALIPIILNTILFGIFFWITVNYFGGWLDSLLPAKDAWYMVILYYLIWVILVLALALGVIFTFTAVSNIVASPFNDAISAKTEIIVTGNKDETAFSFKAIMGEIGRTIVEELKKIGFFIAAMILVMCLNLIPIIGQLLSSALGAAVTITWLGFEFIDYNLARRGWKFGQKMKFIKRNLLAIIGFGMALFVGILIPLFNLVFFPMAVAGGTLLFLDIQSAETRE